MPVLANTLFGPQISISQHFDFLSYNKLRTPLNDGAERASNETLKQTQQRN